MAGEALLSRRLVGRESVVSASGVRRRTEKWVSTYTTEEAAIADPRLPKVGDAHPNDPGMQLDSISFSPEVDGDVQPTLYYSSDKFFEILENKKNVINDEARPGFSSKDFTVRIPSFQIKKSTISTGTASEDIYTWIENPEAATRYTEHRAILKYRVIVPALGIGEIDFILTQIMKLHQLGGVGGNLKYCFMSPEIVPEDSEHDRVTYFWYLDQGTPRPTIIGEGSEKTAIPPELVDDPGYMRYPYHNVEAVAGPDAFSQNGYPLPPYFLQVRYAFEEIGGVNYLQQWQGLPGLT